MNVLRNKQYKQYDYISRYSSFPLYYNSEDEKYIYGLTKQLLSSTTYIAHTLAMSDTLDSIALLYYGRPDLYWIIADYNRIADPYIKLTSKYISVKVPVLSNIEFGEIR